MIALRQIDADALLKVIEEEIEDEKSFCNDFNNETTICYGKGMIQGLKIAYRAIKNQITPNKAHWSINFDGYYPQCSNCGYSPPRELIIEIKKENKRKLKYPRYCPECGFDTERKVK